ncbi:MAG TPA: hypothetical protein VFP61_02315, partial [Acidimicrobiales bacterium]|nr:hypothetical protein [Acidimicrobiales bacterium]
MRTLPAALTGLTAAAAALGLAAGPAFAADSPAANPPANTPAAPATLPAIQAKAASAVSVRVDALQKAAQRVQAAAWLGADQATLLATLQGDVPELQALGQKIAADTDAATAKADYEAIFSQYRVFWLVLPSARLVSTADRITADAGPRAATAIQQLEAHETTADQAQVAPLL